MEQSLSQFTPELLDHIVIETNRYAEQCISATHQGDGLPPIWTTTVDEMKAYIFFAILMGINELPEIGDYSSTNDLLNYFPVASHDFWSSPPTSTLPPTLQHADSQNTTGLPRYAQ